MLEEQELCIGKNSLYSFPTIKEDTLREKAFLFLHRPKHGVRKDKENPALQWAQMLQTQYPTLRLLPVTENTTKTAQQNVT